MRKGPERLVAAQLADEVWQEWSVVEKVWHDASVEGTVEGMAPRQIERAHSAMIRILSL